MGLSFTFVSINSIPMQVTHLFVYPVKSLGGIELTESQLEERGLKYDRRYMLVDEHGQFMSQRTTPQMSLFKTSLSRKGIEVNYSNDSSSSSVTLPFETESSELRKVSIWEDECLAIEVSPEINQFFSNHLSKKCSLVYMPDSTRRLVDTDYALNNEITAFADAFPLLLIGQSSLDDLNKRLPADNQLSWDRFRPNVVVSTDFPFEEDSWEKFRIGDLDFMCAKPCARCVMTTVDQYTGKMGKEPLRTLASYRTVKNKVLFGQNVLIQSTKGILRIGDKVTLIK